MKKSFALACLILAFGLINFSMEKYNVLAFEKKGQTDTSTENSCDASADQTFNRFRDYFKAGKLSNDRGQTLDKDNALGFWKYIFYEALNELYYVHGVSVQSAGNKYVEGQVVSYYSVHQQPKNVAQWEFDKGESLFPTNSGESSGKLTAQGVFELICGSEQFKDKIEEKNDYNSILKSTSHIQMMCLIANEGIYAEVIPSRHNIDFDYLEKAGLVYPYEYKDVVFWHNGSIRNFYFKKNTLTFNELVDEIKNNSFRYCQDNNDYKKHYFKTVPKSLIINSSLGSYDGFIDSDEDEKIDYRPIYNFARNLVHELYLISHDDIYVSDGSIESYNKNQAKAVLKAMHGQSTYRASFDTNTTNSSQISTGNTRSELGNVQQDLAFGDANLSASAVARSQSSFDVGRYLSVGSDEDPVFREYFACGEDDDGIEYYRFRYRGENGEEEILKAINSNSISQLQQGSGDSFETPALAEARENCELLLVEIEHNQADWTIYTFFQQVVRILIMVIGTLAVLALVFGAVRLIIANGDDGQITEASF